MPFVETRFISPTTLTTSAASALYTVPTGYSAIIKQLVVTNITGTAATFTFYIGTASAGNALFSGTSVAANDTVIINLSQVLATGEVLRALASTGSALNLTVSGVLNDGPLASTATYIADNAITVNKIADGSVTTAKIAAGAVDTVDIAANAVTQAKLSTDIPLSGFRNVIINGGFDVWQRGTTASIPIDGSPSSISYLADRWSAYRNTTGSTQSRVTAGLDGFRYALRVQRNSGNTDQLNSIFVSQSFETSEMVKLAGKTVALSFYARAGANWSSTASRLRGTLQAGSGTEANMIYDGIDNGIYPATVSIDFNVGLTTSWQRFTLTGLIPSGSNSGGVNFTWLPQGIPAGAADYFEITGVQLEVGPQATPFEHRPYGTELALCQRYFWAMAVPSSVPGVMVSGFGNYCYMMLSTLNPVPMRIAPVAGVNPSYPLATYPPYIADFNSNLRTVTAVDMSSPLMVRWTYDSTKLTTGLSLGLNYGDANRTLWLSSEL